MYKNLKPSVIMISVNDTIKPKTGGHYVYKVMKDELLKRKYPLREISVPLMLKAITGSEDPKGWREIYRLQLHIRCVFRSFFERCLKNSVVITSSHPAFPVFGHLVYHQPKAGTSIKELKGYITPYRRIGWAIVENEWVSPIWLVAKRSHILHLCNSYFTKQLVKRLYGIESKVLYPPVKVEPFLKIDLKRERKYGIIIAKPEAPSGITMLPQVLQNMPKNIEIIIIGKADQTGLKVIRALTNKGFNLKYLGYVSEEEKMMLLQSISHYLHLGLNEAFGIIVVEAMAAGCIPIAPKSGGIPEYLPESLLYSNPAEAADKILAKIGMDDLDLKLSLRNTAINFSEEHFRIKFADYFEKLVNLLNQS